MTASARSRKAKGRPRRVAVRTCIACRQTGDKRELIRLVRTPNGVVVDPTGKMNGRGAYLHSRHSCWDIALHNSDLLQRALHTELTMDDLLQLSDFSSGLTAARDAE